MVDGPLKGLQLHFGRLRFFENKMSLRFFMAFMALGAGALAFFSFFSSLACCLSFEAVTLSTAAASSAFIDWQPLSTETAKLTCPVTGTLICPDPSDDLTMPLRIELGMVKGGVANNACTMFDLRS